MILTLSNQTESIPPLVAAQLETPIVQFCGEAIAIRLED